MSQHSLNLLHNSEQRHEQWKDIESVTVICQQYDHQTKTSKVVSL